MPITKTELVRSVRNLPLSSSRHGILMARAYVSFLQKEAYDEYTKLWVKKQTDGYANLWRGASSHLYFSWAWRPSLGGAPKNPSLMMKIYRIADTCLAKSVKLLPDSPDANSAYGFFLWRARADYARGRALMEKAIKLNPRNVGYRTRLADVLSNPRSSKEDLERAEFELLTATKLSSTAGSPRLLLARHYMMLGKYTKAQSAMNDYLKLIPPNVKPFPGVQTMRRTIQEGLRA